MRELQKGDRVRVFFVDDSGNDESFVGTVVKQDGCAVWVDTPHTISSKDRPTFDWPYHRRSVRKLVKKERRRVWVHPGLLSGAIASNHQDATPDRVHGERVGWLEFREVRKAKP